LVGGTGSTSSAPDALRLFSALLMPRLFVPADTGLVNCNPTGCTYVVPAHTTLSVTLELYVAPESQPGFVALSVEGWTTSLPIKVTAGLTGLTLRVPPDWTIGVPVQAELIGTVMANVTNAGTITLPTRGADLWLARPTSPDSGRCSLSTDGLSLICTPLAPDNGTVDFGYVTVTAVMPGVLHAAATLPGIGGALALTGPDGGDLHPSRPRVDQPTDITGPFDGVLLGASAMECRTLNTTRGRCNPGLSDVSHPQQLTIPQGATVISAILTWAATSPRDGDPDSLNSVHFHTDIAASEESCYRIGPVDNQHADHSCIATGLQPITLGSDSPGRMYMRSVEVSSLIGREGTVWLDDIDASRTTTGMTPMAGWTLSVVWSRPGKVASINLANPAIYSLSSEPDAPVQLAAAGPAISDLSIVVWAADPWGDKQVKVDGQPIKVLPIEGVRFDDVEENSGYATGFNLVSGISAGSGSSVTLTNTPKRIAAPWRRPGDFSYQDALWVGPTMVIRAPS
jgi:hypothetical protein